MIIRYSIACDRVDVDIWNAIDEIGTARQHIYIVALGSNMRHQQFGCSQNILRHMRMLLSQPPLTLLSFSKIIASDPIGPSQRRYSNAAAIISTGFAPLAMLKWLQNIEHNLGRKHYGQRWRQRVIDLDIILWSQGSYRAKILSIPHTHFRVRPFVLIPVAMIAPRWCDPVTGYTMRQLKVQLDRQRPAA